MLFKVAGKFADRHSFSINPVDGADAKEALGNVLNSTEIKEYGSPVVLVSVKALGGSKSKIKISDKPAAERKNGKKKTAPATPAAAPAATSGSRKK